MVLILILQDFIDLLAGAHGSDSEDSFFQVFRITKW